MTEKEALEALVIVCKNLIMLTDPIIQKKVPIDKQDDMRKNAGLELERVHEFADCTYISPFLKEARNEQ